MADHYGDESQSASDQDELVGNTDLEDELTDFDDVQFNYCKQSSAEQAASEMDGSSHCAEQKSKIIFFGATIALFVTAFALLISFPLYLQQLSVEGKQNNAYGAILYTSALATVIIILITLTVSYAFKWNIQLLRPPIQWKRWVIINWSKNFITEKL